MAEAKDPLKNGDQEKPVQKIGIKRGIEPDKPQDLAPDQVQDRRGRPVYLARTKWRIPPWIIALVVFVALMAGLFVVVPILVDQASDFDDPQTPGISQPDQGQALLQNPDLAVVKVASAPLLDAPHARAVRLAEALFNEMVTIVDSQGRDYLLVRLQDGVQGYIRRDQLSADKLSVVADNALAKVLVRDASKRIISHARQGSLLVEAPMGTVLYADYRNGDLLRVRLPDQTSGWINSSGVILLPPQASIGAEDNWDQLLVASMMTFIQSPQVPGGVTRRGISMEGALYVSGRLNGLTLTRDRQALMSMGQAVSLPLDDQGARDLTYLAEGDLVFFHEKYDQQAIRALAIRVTDDQLLLGLPNKSKLQLMDLESSQAKELAQAIMTARRFDP
jgi:hypothetical protein